MKLISFLIPLFLAGALIAQKNPADNQKLHMRLFENDLYSLDAAQLNLISTMLHDFASSSPQQLKDAAIIVQDALKQQIKSLKTQIDTYKKLGKTIPFSPWRTMHLLIQQKKHLGGYISHQPEKSWWQTIISWVEDGLTKTGLYKSEQEKLAQEILAFIKIEREHMLSSYPATMAYLRGLKNHDLPKMINFWKEKRHRARLLQDIRSISPEAVKPQNFIVDMIIQTAIMMGESRYEEWASQPYLDYYTALSTQETQMNDDFNTFEEDLAAQQETSITNLSTAFTASITELNDERTKTDALQANQITFMENLIDTSLPKVQYISSCGEGVPLTTCAIEFDQAFELSKMYTPDNGLVWYNIYPQPNVVLNTAAELLSTSGQTTAPKIATDTDWQYNNSRGQFFQNNLIPFQASQEIQDSISQSNPEYLPDTGQYAHNNSIFCEYITGQASYYIDVDCTLINSQYPFFVGVIFNKARWISGVAERIEQYRLVGLYGSQDAQGNKTASLAFAEYKYVPAPDENSQPTITPPLAQIIDPNNQPLATLDAATVASLGKNSFTFNVSVLTQPTAVTLSISTTDDAGNKKDLVQNKVISGLDPLLYIYHGIGLITPGCQAAFKINKPEALTYSAEETTNFQTLINNAIASQGT